MTYSFGSHVEYKIEIPEIKSETKAKEKSIIAMFDMDSPIKKKKKRKNKNRKGKIEYRDHNWTVLDTQIVNY